MHSSLGDSPEDKKNSNPSKQPQKAKKRRGRVKIEFIQNKSKRHTTFSKRKSGLMKKVYELTTLTGSQALLLICSEGGHVYTFATPKLQPLVTTSEGKGLIQNCLNEADSTTSNNKQNNSGFQDEEGGEYVEHLSLIHI
eukprot:TRINITY_DN3884_c0_g1_i4.p1 TRINITY_DN3884_c0_g1~~TRINITY_DN3884_c0_g1_i4.p1  ORF type:complete len:139 (-),score=28.51 TRINITY_DN3884_c0_g1_i4:23-439(-)